MSDAFAARVRSPAAPAVTHLDITPDDVEDLPHVTTALNVAAPGTVRVTMADGSVGDLTIHPGQPFFVRTSRDWLTGTSATGIRGLA